MRLFAPAVALALLCSLSLPATAATSPDWTLTTPDGEAVRLSDAVEEQPVVLLFWATWCPYCKALMPHLQSIRFEYGDAVRVLAIHFRDDDGDPVAFVNEAGYDFTLLPDGGDVAELYEVWGTPGVLIIDGDMQIRFDLRDLPRNEPPELGASKSHRKKAAWRAPWWAAAVRKQLDDVLAE